MHYPYLCAVCVYFIYLILNFNCDTTLGELLTTALWMFNISDPFGLNYIGWWMLLNLYYLVLVREIEYMLLAMAIFSIINWTLFAEICVIYLVFPVMSILYVLLLCLWKFRIELFVLWLYDKLLHIINSEIINLTTVFWYNGTNHSMSELCKISLFQDQFSMIILRYVDIK